MQLTIVNQSLNNKKIENKQKEIDPQTPRHYQAMQRPNGILEWGKNLPQPRMNIRQPPQGNHMIKYNPLCLN